jgi:phosphatidylinositol alpha-1,6-mannosyltransferase
MSDERRIVIASTDFRPMVGGVADHLHRIAHALSSCADVTVMTTVPQRGLKWSHSYRLDALRRLPDRRLGRRAGDSVPFIRRMHTGTYFLALKRYARDVIRRAKARQDGRGPVMIGIWDTASHFWCSACREAGVPYYVVAHGLEILIPLYGDLPEWRRADFAGAAGVIANSRATADLAVSRLEVTTPPMVVNPIAGDLLTGPAVEGRARELRQLLGDGGPMLLSVGRLVARKGFDTVIESIAELRGEFPRIRYVAIGDGPEREHLYARAAALGVAEHVIMLGRADDAMKWAAYGLCDLFVMPNRSLGGADWEGFGIVFAEAARAGRAVVAGTSGGVADAVIDGQTGLLIEADQPGALTRGVRQLLADAHVRTAMGQAAARLAAERFTTDALRAQLLAVLQWN